MLLSLVYLYHHFLAHETSQLFLCTGHRQVGSVHVVPTVWYDLAFPGLSLCSLLELSLAWVSDISLHANRRTLRVVQSYLAQSIKQIVLSSVYSLSIEARSCSRLY